MDIDWSLCCPYSLTVPLIPCPIDSLSLCLAAPLAHCCCLTIPWPAVILTHFHEASLSHCLLSHWLTVTMPHCPTVTVSQWLTVPLTHCHDASRTIATLSHWLIFVMMPHCPTRIWTNFLVTNCLGAFNVNCHTIQLIHYPIAHCPIASLSHWLPVPLPHFPIVSLSYRFTVFNA